MNFDRLRYVAERAEIGEHRVYFLGLQDVTRLDVVNFVSHGVPKVQEQGKPESDEAAGALKRSGLKSLVIDLSDRPDGAAKTLATAMAALYLPLPYAEAHDISQHVGAAMKNNFAHNAKGQR